MCIKYIMKSQSIFIFFFCAISICQAQVSIGPTIGLNYAFVEFQNTTLKKFPISSSFKFRKKSKLAPSIGFKTEIPINKNFFISANSAYLKSSNRLYACHLVCGTAYFEMDQILAMSSLNYIFPKQISIGLGVNYLRGTYKYQFDGVMMPKFKDVGILFSGNYKFKQFVLEMFYVQSIKSFGTKLSDNTFFIKPINNLQFSLSYLFKAKFRSGEKDIDCPRF